MLLFFGLFYKKDLVEGKEGITSNIFVMMDICQKGDLESYFSSEESKNFQNNSPKANNIIKYFEDCLKGLTYLHGAWHHS